jgi:hypothetical protein
LSSTNLPDSDLLRPFLCVPSDQFIMDHIEHAGIRPCLSATKSAKISSGFENHFSPQPPTTRALFNTGTRQPVAATESFSGSATLLQPDLGILPVEQSRKNDGWA